MKSPFPGMDPYLEGSQWPSFHAWFIPSAAMVLQQAVGPEYWVAIEQKVYWTQASPTESYSVPDAIIVKESSAPYRVGGGAGVAAYDVTIPEMVEVRERFIEIRTIPDQRVVTVVELLSPTNKRPGEGRDNYLHKRANVIMSGTNLVELDLLRGFGRLPMHGAPSEYDYGFLIHWASKERSSLFIASVRVPLPQIPVPLAWDTADAAFDLQQAFDTAYQNGNLNRAVDYRLEPELALMPEDKEWADRLLVEKGHR